MMRVEFGDDPLLQAELVMAIEELDGAPSDEGGGDFLGIGLHRYRFPDGELTVFVDAWGFDVAGPDELVRRVLAAMQA